MSKIVLYLHTKITNYLGSGGDEKSPLFIQGNEIRSCKAERMEQEVVRQLVREAIKENEKLFLIELSFLAENKILVEVDGDDGVSLRECIRISRHVEHSLDREEEDFGLEVTSVDASKPLKVVRQYKKNTGRILSINTLDGQKVEGTVVSADDKMVNLEWKARESKPIGKGKVTVVKTAAIDYKNIQEAKVKIIFN
jgi:ribosome maturation factor RimP